MRTRWLGKVGEGTGGGGAFLEQERVVGLVQVLGIAAGVALHGLRVGREAPLVLGEALEIDRPAGSARMQGLAQMHLGQTIEHHGGRMVAA